VRLQPLGLPGQRPLVGSGHHQRNNWHTTRMQGVHNRYTRCVQ
jgi:hypothetical protein